MALFRKNRDASPPERTIAPLLGLIAADLAVRTGQRLLRRSVQRTVLNDAPIPGRVIRGKSLGETVVSTVLAEVARRSVPGAILVGGGLIAQALNERRKARKAAAEKTEA